MVLEEVEGEGKMIEKNRSVGITILGWICLIFAVYYILGSLFIVLKSGLLNKISIMPLVGLSYLIVGIGILKRKNWARLSLLVMMVFVLFGSINSGIIFFRRISRPDGVVTPFLDSIIAFIALCYLALPLVNFYYLTRSKVKDQFK